MNFRRFAFVLAIGLFSPLLLANAKVANLGVTGNSDHLNLLWDRLSAADFGNAEGYAMQWSDRQSDVKITKPVNIYRDGNLDDINLRRNSFENDRFYYARVYSYTSDENNQKTLGNGSDMLKFKITFQNDVTSESISITDPVVNTTSNTTQDNNDFEFGALRKYPYDTFADFFWSSPREMISSDFDGFVIALSKNSDMADPLIEAETSRDTTSMRLTGLAPATQYYAQGFFYKNQGGETKKFGDSVIKPFKTIAAIPRDGSTRASRNIAKVEKRAIRKADVNDTTSTTSTTTSSSTSSSSSSSSTTTTTTSQSDINRADQAEVKRNIADLKRRISSLQSELRRWEAKLEGGSTSSSTSTSSNSSTSTSNKQQSLRERLKAILAAKRKK